jgi:hypothetical protein
MPRPRSKQGLHIEVQLGQLRSLHLFHKLCRAGIAKVLFLNLA